VCSFCVEASVANYVDTVALVCVLQAYYVLVAAKSFTDLVNTVSMMSIHGSADVIECVSCMRMYVCVHIDAPPKAMSLMAHVATNTHCSAHNKEFAQTVNVAEHTHKSVNRLLIMQQLVWKRDSTYNCVLHCSLGRTM
jgi:hypothetical protein